MKQGSAGTLSFSVSLLVFCSVLFSFPTTTARPGGPPISIPALARTPRLVSRLLGPRQQVKQHLSARLLPTSLPGQYLPFDELSTCRTSSLGSIDAIGPTVILRIPHAGHKRTISTSSSNAQFGQQITFCRASVRREWSSHQGTATDTRPAPSALATAPKPHRQQAQKGLWIPGPEERDCSSLAPPGADAPGP